MEVRKRSGNFEPVNLDKIIKSIERVCTDLNGSVDVYNIGVKTIGGVYNGVSTKELDELSIQSAVGMISTDPIYSKVAARLLSNYIHKEVENQEIFSFSQSIEIGFSTGLISEQTYNFVKENKRKLNNLIDRDKDKLFEYYGLRIVYDRYLLKHPEKRTVIETPQYWLLRVACGLAETAKEAVEFYNLISTLDYIPATPTLFNSGTTHSQMSSCYLLDSPEDNLTDIYKRYGDIAQLSKWAGGIGLSYSRVRENGRGIKGTNGKSNGIRPWIHTLSASVGAVNQGGKRKGAAAVYLETHHPDIMEFLELRDNTGDVEKRAHNLNLANWIPDLFMNRVLKNEKWSLISPVVAPELTDLFGEEYERRYLELEAEGKFVKQIPARQIYARMMRTLAETGNGWMCFKDTSNNRSNTAVNGNIAHSSNLCTEIIEPTSSKETAVCNLGQLNVSNCIKDGKLDKAKIRKIVSIGMKYLDRVIDRNFYPIPESENSNVKWRPVGLGMMGLQDLFFKLKVPFDSEEAIKISEEIQEEVYYQALKTSCELAKQNGFHTGFKQTHAAKGNLQFDLAGFNIDTRRWNDLKCEIKEHGLRNSLLIAIAPTVTTSAITGVYECIEPQISNLFKRETLSGEFVTVNKYLVKDLKEYGLWNEQMLTKIKAHNGSIQNIEEIPVEIRNLYKTVWEIPNKALIDHAVARGKFIDQSQSLNLFMENPSIGKLSSMYQYAWSKGIKTTYYLRSKAASKIQTITAGTPTNVIDRTDTPMAPENPDICESCT